MCVCVWGGTAISRDEMTTRRAFLAKLVENTNSIKTTKAECLGLPGKKPQQHQARELPETGHS